MDAQRGFLYLRRNINNLGALWEFFYRRETDPEVRLCVSYLLFKEHGRDLLGQISIYSSFKTHFLLSLVKILDAEVVNLTSSHMFWLL